MPLTDLLQWLCNARVTGTLRVELDRVSKSIHLVKGMITGCSSNDPAQRLGHFLLNRGQITEEQLREALQLQELSGKYLGSLLVELGALSEEDLSENLEAQAEETIHSLFDWDDAVFRFQESENDTAHAFPVSLRVEDVLLRGLKRFDEMRQIREVFDNPGIVLEKTDKKPPAAVIENRMGSALWELVDGERTVAEILLQVHGSEYVVTKFLFELHRSGLVRIVRVKEIATAPPIAQEPVAESIGVQAEEPAAAGTRAAAAVDLAGQPPAKTTEEEPAAAVPAPKEPIRESEESEESELERIEDLLSDFNPEIDHAAAAPPEPEADATVAAEEIAAEDTASNSREKGVVSLEDSAAHSLEASLEKARRLMSESEFEKALVILERVYRDQPGEESLRRLTAEAEAAFVEKAYRHYLPPSKVLALTRTMDELETEDLSPSEFFMLSRIDGTWDIKSIIQIAPLRESDALRTLKRLRENGLIELKDP
jgi:hypothetical protein